MIVEIRSVSWHFRAPNFKNFPGPLDISHLRCSISPTNMKTAPRSLMLATCCRNDSNFAQITCPLPSAVDVALQYKWLTHGFTHGRSSSPSFSFAILLKTFETSTRICPKITYLKTNQSGKICKLCVIN